MSYEIRSSSAPEDFPSIPMPPFPSFIEPFKPTFETGIGIDPNANSIVKGNAFDLLQYDYQSDHNVLFELTGFEGAKYYNQFEKIYPIDSLDLSEFQDLLRFHFRQTCYRAPVKSNEKNKFSRVIECDKLVNEITNAYECENFDDKPSNQCCKQAAQQFFNDLLFTCNQSANF